MSEYKGVIHIHTRFSDGSAKWRDLLKLAQKLKLDYLIITDHNTLRAKEKEGWYNNETLLLAGQEITPVKRHYLALGIKRAIYPSKGNPQKYIDEVNTQGGIGFIVHPFYRGKRHLSLVGHPWENISEIDGFSGIELWSWMYDWVEPVNYFNLFFHFLFPHRAITGPPAELLEAWDRLISKRRVSALAGLDVHGFKIFPGFTIFPYEEVFKTLRTHILTPSFSYDLEEDSRKVYKALKQGNCWLANDYLADSSGFSFGTSTGKVMGEEVKLQKRLRLEASSPQATRFCLIHKGKKIYEAEGGSFAYPVSKPGPYRLEAYLDHKPWIFTNPVYVLTDKQSSPDFNPGVNA